MSIAAEVAQLEQSIKLGAPTIAGDLVKVLKQLHGRPELVHMLSEEGIGVIVSGLLTTKALEVPEPAKKKTSSRVSKTMSGDLDL